MYIYTYCFSSRNFSEISRWLYLTLDSHPIALSFLFAFFSIRHQDEFKLQSLANGLSDVFALFYIPFLCRIRWKFLWGL